MKTLIVNWGALTKFGGIEKINYYLIKFMSEHDVRVIWLKNEKSPIGEAFKTVLYHENVEIVNVSSNHLFWFKHDKINIRKDEQVVVVSYTVFDMLRALSLKEEFVGFDMTCFYTVPDTTGNFFFIERYFKGWLNGFVYRHIRQTLLNWNDAGLIFFCAPLQITSFENNYRLTVEKHNDRLLKSLYGPEPLDEENLKARSKKTEKFNIITVGRFDFPHKGYILGLVKAFGRLKPVYPQLTLTIIGKGKDEDILKDEISHLSDDVRKDVFLLGEVPHVELPRYYKDKHLSVAVAGSTWDAAKCGVVSLVARNHFGDECEVYGFLPEESENTVSSKKGELVDDYIKEVIDWPEELYISKCKDAYKLLGQNVDPWFYFEAVQKVKDYRIPHSELALYKIINYVRKFILLF